MKVSASQPFQIIYSLYQHEYLGFVFESYIVHLDEKGKLTYQHQNISAKNAREFSKGLDDRDFEGELLNEAPVNDDSTGDDLDIPQGESKLSKEDGEEDEENDYYSLGGDKE